MFAPLEVKDRRLSEQEVFTDILFVVSVLHFLLVDVVNELLDLVLGVSSASGRRKPWILLIGDEIMCIRRRVLAEKLRLKERR